jgi:hypothetical protein
MWPFNFQYGRTDSSKRYISNKKHPKSKKCKIKQRSRYDTFEDQHNCCWHAITYGHRETERMRQTEKRFPDPEASRL